MNGLLKDLGATQSDLANSVKIQIRTTAQLTVQVEHQQAAAWRVPLWVLGLGKRKRTTLTPDFGKYLRRQGGNAMNIVEALRDPNLASELLASEIIGETADEIRLNGNVTIAFAYRALEKTRSELYGSDDYSVLTACLCRETIPAIACDADYRRARWDRVPERYALLEIWTAKETSQGNSFFQGSHEKTNQ